uniref:DHHA2 domain-containing protein n=1 Tax=Chaetoceros debilis TaxID=122233 RepID=A0A7S3PY90_9STRA
MVQAPRGIISTATASFISKFLIITSLGSFLPAFALVPRSRPLLSSNTAVFRRQSHTFLSKMSTSALSMTDFSTYHNSVTTEISSFSKTKNVNYNIILGNEAGDADSIISALAYSYVKASAKDINPGIGSSCSSIVNLPLASIPRNDLALRRDVTLLLEMVGIDGGKLIFVDDESFTNIANDDGIQKSVSLMDHNKLRSDLRPLHNFVDEILDHHKDEGSHNSVQGENREIAFDDQFALVGSTCTLVVEKIMKQKQSMDNFKLDAGLGLVLLGVILLDTMNMCPNAAKGTQRDEEAIQFIIHESEWSTFVVNSNMQSNLFESDDDDESQRKVPIRSRLYEYLRDSKFDRFFWESMEITDALRIDYKRFEPSSEAKDAFGLSSILLDTETLVAKPYFKTKGLEYMRKVNINLLGALNMVIVDDKPQREIVLLGASDDVNKMAHFLVNDDSTSFLEISNTGYIESSPSDEFVAVTLKQGNPKGSRKQIAPAMMSFFQK